MTDTDLETAWSALLERLAAQRASLVDDFIALLAERGSYAGTDISDEDLRTSADMTLELQLLQIAGAPVPERLRDVPERLGRRRAQQGVDRETLLEAVRLDFRVIWAGLVRARGDAPADRLVAHAEEVLAVVEAYIGDVQIAYLSEVDAMSRDSRAESRRALARLLSAEAPPDELAAELAPALGLPIDGTFAVMCVVDADESQLRPSGAVIDWQVEEGLLLLCLDDTQFDEGLRGSVVRGVQGLASVPDAAVRARRIARFLGGAANGLVTVAETELALARSLLEAELPGVRNPVLSGLAALDASEAARIIETAQAYCASGSVKATAERQYVHRNTVVNRLAQFRRHTGLDLNVPDEAARALLWLP